MSNYHVPVMLKEVIEGLDVQPGKKYIDATLGGGGHATEITKLGGILLGLDTDQDALEFVRQKLGTGNWKLVQGNFREIEKIAKEEGFTQVDGILFDLGVSSHQLDTPKRGFSYRFADETLDLRLDQTKGETAADLINKLSEIEIYEILAKYAEEQLARPIARALVRSRRLKPIRTTGDLVKIIDQVTGKRQSAVLSRVFQALRIVVNDELNALKQGLVGAKNILRQDGRLAVISFHSLEDRIVKQFFRSNDWKLISKKAIIPTEREITENVRSRSAKLRMGLKIC